MYESNKTEYHAFSAEYFSLLILATNKKIIISRWVHDFARQFKIFSMRYYNIPTHVHLCISFPACMPKHWTLKFIYIESAIIRRWRRVVYDPIYIYILTSGLQVDYYFYFYCNIFTSQKYIRDDHAYWCTNKKCYWFYDGHQTLNIVCVFACPDKYYITSYLYEDEHVDTFYLYVGGV